MKDFVEKNAQKNLHQLYLSSMGCFADHVELEYVTRIEKKIIHRRILATTKNDVMNICNVFYHKSIG